MAYPDDKETFRRVVNQELPDIPGDVVDQDDQNLPADFLERLQDTFGYNIKMGFASVKDFFNDIVSKFATIKKVDIITLYQGSGGGLIEAGQWREYTSAQNFIATDIVLFQVNLNWRATSTTETKISITLYRVNTQIGPTLAFESDKIYGFRSSVLNYVLTNPTPGEVLYKVRIYNSYAQAWLEYITFTAIKISI